jgi:2-iminobutanoate/2-iminopropanoate deaminase
MKKIISTNKAPAAIGPYSQAVETGGLLFISGQLPIDPATGLMAPAEIKAQTEAVIKNLEGILKSEGLGLENIVKTTVFMADLGQFAQMNEVYAKFFAANPPARATVEVKALPKAALVEIEAVAAR